MRSIEAGLLSFDLYLVEFDFNVIKANGGGRWLEYRKDAVTFEPFERFSTL